MDDPVESPAELRGNLREIERLNRLTGATRTVVRALARSGAASVLDVGSGHGDIAAAALRWAARNGRALRVTCLDRSAQMLALARERNRTANVDFVCADGRALPFADGAFDAVMCNLSLHHFDPDDAVALLRELRRVARLRPFVTDLRRTRLGYVSARVLIGIASRNRLTRHDGPLSVLRSYTPNEARELAQRAGWRDVRVSASLLRMLMWDGAGA